MDVGKSAMNTQERLEEYERLVVAFIAGILGQDKELSSEMIRRMMILVLNSAAEEERENND